MTGRQHHDIDAPPVVKCLDCDTTVTTPRSRARRYGERCWRKRRARARASRIPVTLPGLAGHGDRAGLDGPTLLDHTDPDPTAGGVG